MANPWFRMYSEFSHDPKVQMLNEVMQRRYVMLMCMRCSNELVTLHETEIAFHLRISETDMAETKALFISKGFIDSEWNLLNWEKRQMASDSSNARVAKHRALQKEKHEQVCNVTETKSNGLEEIRIEEIRVDKKNTNKPKSAAPPFPLPSWINSKHWDTWHSCAKRKNATPDQKQMAVDKLAAWRDAGEDFAGALENAAIGGNQGLFLPSKPFAKTITGETPYQKSMRERMSEFAPGIARRAPGQEFTDLESINVVAITRN